MRSLFAVRRSSSIEDKAVLRGDGFSVPHPNWECETHKEGRDMIDWNDESAPAVDGFTVGEIKEMAMDSVVTAICEVCYILHEVEPDARDYRCQECKTPRSVTSPLVKLGII